MDGKRIRRSGTGPIYLPLLAMLLLATATAARLPPNGPLGEARERVARENVQL